MTQTTNRYTEHGYKDRDDYLTQLAEDYGVNPIMVFAAAEMYGPNEDFDGLISAIDDLQELMI